MEDIPICECATFWETHHDECPVRREVESLRAELAEWKATTPALKPDCRTCGYFEWRVYKCWFESSNPNRLCVDGSEHLHADPVRLYETGEA